jgi:hypothetical protein
MAALTGGVIGSATGPPVVVTVCAVPPSILYVRLRVSVPSGVSVNVPVTCAPPAQAFVG